MSFGVATRNSAAIGLAGIASLFSGTRDSGVFAGENLLTESGDSIVQEDGSLLLLDEPFWSLFLDFTTSNALDPRITFTRASTATYFNSAGVLTTANNNVARFDYNPSTLQPRGLLIEEQRTNLCLQSEDFFQNGTGAVNWIWPAGLITSNTQVAPDGTTTADTVTSAGGANSIYQSITVTASTAYTFSLFVKLGTMMANDYKIAIYNNTAAAFIASDITPTQTPNSSGWTKISYAFTTPAGCTSVRVYPFRNSAGISSSTVFIWGAQLEAGAFATSYIPTTTTALTRNADVASMTGTNFSSWYNASEGTLYAEPAIVAPRTSDFTVLRVDDGTSSNRLQTGSGSSATIFNSFIINSGAPQGNNIVSVSPVGTRKLAFAYGANSSVTSASGSVGTTDTTVSVPAGVNRLLIGRDDTAGYINGWIGRVTYYPTRLPNSTLQALTA